MNKKIMAMFIAIIVNYPVVSLGAPCAILEYQELKEMPKQSLIKLYCDVSNQFTTETLSAKAQRISVELHNNLAATETGSERLIDKQEAARFRAAEETSRRDAQQCREQLERIGRVIEKRGGNLVAAQRDCEQRLNKQQ